MKKQIKKGLSLMMAILMVLSCWVWVAPTEAEAATAGKYYFRLVYTTTDSADSDNRHLYIIYKDNNGKGTEEKHSADYGSQLTTSEETTVTVSGSCDGFPIGFRFQARLNNAFGKVRFEPVRVYISGTPGGVLEESALVYNDAWTWDNGGSSNVDYDSAQYFKDLEYPKPTSIGGFTTSPVNVTVPKIGQTGMASSALMTGIVYDQYGAQWYEAPDYNLSAAEGNYEADETMENVLTLTEQGDGAKINVAAAMQTASQIANTADATYKRYYLVASISAGELTPVASQPININYPQYRHIFKTDYVTNAGDAPTVNTLNDGTTYTGTINEDNEISDVDKKFMRAYGQSLLAYPVNATKEGYTFQGYWTEPQPNLPVDGTDPSAYALEKDFRAPVDTKTYNELYANDDELKNKYYPAGVKWDPTENPDLLTVTEDETYYAWFLADDITVKFYQLNGKYIDEFTTKYGLNHNDPSAVWPQAGTDFPSSYETGSFSYSNWTGTWEDINGNEVNPGGHRFTKNLVLTPIYRNINFTDTYSVTVYRGTQSATYPQKYSKDYSYRDTAVLPPASEVVAIPAGNDYRYEFVGWSTSAPEVLHQGVHMRHIILEDADFDTAGNAVFLAEDFIVRDNVSYYPVYRRYLQSHDVTFTYTDSTGASVTKTKTFKYGETITAPDGVPGEYAFNGFGYKGLGWVVTGTEEIVDLKTQLCTKPGMSYAMKYSEGVPTPYNVTFEYRNSEGEIETTTVQVNHGTNILQETLDSLPIADEYDDKELNALVRYNGIWICNDVEYDVSELTDYSPTSHVTFTAVYGDPTPFFNATYVDGANTESFRIIEGAELEPWLTAEGEPYEPVRDDTVEGEYTFIGWSDTLQTEEQIIAGEIAGEEYIAGVSAIYGDVTLYPQFSFSKFTYKITFLNWNGDVLATGLFNYRDDLADLRAEAEAAAAKVNDVTYSYTFIGWDKVVPSFCEGGVPGGETVFVAQYKANYLYYAVEWYNDADLNAEEKLGEGKYVYGDKIYAPGVTLTPPAADEEGKTMVFDAWKYLDKDGNVQTYTRGMILGDAVIPASGNPDVPVKMWATYKEATLTHKVKVVVDDGVNPAYDYTIEVEDGMPLGDALADPADGWLTDTTHNEFTIWTDAEDNEFTAETPVTADGIVIYANFIVDGHNHENSEDVVNPTFPMAGYTDFDGTEVPAFDGKGKRAEWCSCSKEKTYRETGTIDALTDTVAPGATGYIGTANWTDFEEAAAAPTVYANKATALIITTRDAGDVIALYNANGKGIGIQTIETIMAPASVADLKTVAELEAYEAANTIPWKIVYNWTEIQASLIAFYGGWAKVPAAYKDYNANYTDSAGSYGLTDGETYVAYVKITDKAGNVGYLRSAKFIYDETKPELQLSGTSNYRGDIFCEQAVLKVTEATREYEVRDNGAVINVSTLSGEYKIGPGAHNIIVTDEAGNKSSIYFQVTEEHKLYDYNVEATCFEDGFTSQRCANCGEDFNKVIIEAYNHNYVDTIVPATCTQPGYISRECTICDNPAEAMYYDSEGNLLYPALTHDYGEFVVTKEATCVETGTMVKTCKRNCGEENAQIIETIPVDLENGHTYRTITIKPSCSLGGEKYARCRDSRCGDIKLLAHGYVEGDGKFDAAIHTAELFDESLAATNHKDTKEVWEVTAEATCVAEGTETKKCSICNAVIKDAAGNAVTRTIAKVPHIWMQDVENSKAPTTDEAGYIAYKCAVCGGAKLLENGELDVKPIDKLEQYTITFVVEGVDYASFTKVYGETIAATDVTAPTKAATDEYTYEFAGWFVVDADGKITNTEYTLPLVATGNVKLAAKFKESRIFYTSVFKVPTKYNSETGKFTDYEVSKSLMGGLNDVRLPGETPVFAETDTYTFEFKGWTYTNGADYDGKIADNGTYHAKFAVTQKKYSVIFMNGMTYYDKAEVLAGEDAAVPAVAPTKASDADYHYTFSGWYTSSDCKTLATFENITETTTVYAGFTAAGHDKGESGTIKTPADCDDSEITTYTCKDCGYAWDEVTDSALGHKKGAPVYNAETGKNEIFCTVCGVKLEEADASYTITFVDHNGRRLDTLEVEVNKTFYAQAAEAAKRASKASDNANTYTFIGWALQGTTEVITSDKLPAATADVTYVAQYKAEARVYTVTFAKSDYTAVVSFSGIEYGKLTDKNGFNVSTYAFSAETFGIPASNANSHFVFDGWNYDFSKGITKDTLVTPKYKEIAHDFDKNNDGAITTADAVVTSASCTVAGGYKYTCEDCGYSYVNGNVSALGHNWVTTITKEPGFETEGVATKTCQRCGETITESIPAKSYFTVQVTVKDTNGVAYEGAKVTITHKVSGKSYGPNLTNANGVATFSKVEEEGTFFVSVVQIPGHDGGLSGEITIDGSGNVTGNTVPTLKGESNKDCSCACHRSNFWGMLFRFFHNIIKMLTGRYTCCECPDSRY